MGAGKSLSTFEKGEIIGLKANDWSVSAIARHIKRSRTVIANFIKNPEKYGTAKSPGRPQILTTREQRSILKLASNSEVSANKIKTTQNLPVSKDTILRVIHRCQHLARKKMNVAPRLTKEHKVKRLEFARINMKRDWKRVINFSFWMTFTKLKISYYR